MILVDDGSSDGTGDIVRAHARDMHLAVVRHPVNSGLGAAINTGIRAALSEAVDDDAIVTLEADTTSDLNDLAAHAGGVRQGRRHRARLGLHAGRPRCSASSQKRIALSKSVSTSFRYLGGLQNMHTLSSLYRVYRAGTLRKAADTYGYLLVREPGFAANVELLLKLYAAGATIAEVPTTNDWSTRKGQSKMKLKPTALAYFRVMIAHLAGRIQPPARSPLADAKRERSLQRRPRRPRHCPPASPSACRSGRLRAHERQSQGRRRRRRHPRLGPRPAPGAGRARRSRCSSVRRASAAWPATMDFGGHQVDRFYHVITPADGHMIGLAEELGLGDQLRFRPVGAGFCIDGELHDFNGVGDLAALQAADPDPAPAPGLVRRAVPGAQKLSAGSTTCRSRSTSAATAGKGVCERDLEAAAGLALRAPPRGPARHLPVVAHAPHVDRPRGRRQRRGVRPL